jgi:hypothetical protein
MRLSPPIADVIERFISRNTGTSQDRDHVVLECASRRANHRDPDYHTQLLCRAALLLLLLRVATGETWMALSGAGIGTTELDFWWPGVLSRRGISKATSSTSDLSSLWSEVADPLMYVQEWHDANETTGPSLYQFRDDCSSALMALGDCELIGLWGMTA